jgi:hypothetical protein
MLLGQFLKLDQQYLFDQNPGFAEIEDGKISTMYNIHELWDRPLQKKHSEQLQQREKIQRPLKYCWFAVRTKFEGKHC